MVFIEIYEQGKLPSQHPLTSHAFVLGRSDECEYTVKDPYISGRNTKVQLQVVVSDLGSRNGTWLDEKQINEQTVVPFGNLVRLGRDQNVAFRVGMSEGGTQPGTDSGTMAEPDRERLAALQQELAERNRELSDLRRDLKLATEAAAHVGTLEEQVQQLERQLAERDRKPGTNFETLAAPPSGEVELPSGADADPDAEVVRLNARVKDLEEQLVDVLEERAAEEAARKAAPAGEPAPAARVVTVQDQGAAAQALAAFMEGGSDLEPALVDTIKARDDLAVNLGYALGRLYRFGRDVEKVVTRIAQEYRGAQMDQTMLPGMGGNLSRSVNGLLLKGGEDRRRELDEYLQKTRVWWFSCLGAPRQAVGQWYKEVLLRISPSHIEKETSVSALKKAAGLDAAAYWKCYRSLMDDLTHDIAMDEIDGLTADLAVKMAEKEGVRW